MSVYFYLIFSLSYFYDSYLLFLVSFGCVGQYYSPPNDLKANQTIHTYDIKNWDNDSPYTQIIVETEIIITSKSCTYLNDTIGSSNVY